jgi:hypothetical protein
MHDWLTFELQRRVNEPYDYATKALADSAALDAGVTLDLDEHGLLVLEEPFRPAAFPYEHALHGQAVLTTKRGRRVAPLRLELTAWSEDATALALRPLSARPDRWSPHRMQQYFQLGHLAADGVAHIVAAETAACRG